MNNQVIGQKSEFEFIKILNEHGIPYEYTNIWYDFKILNTYVDVKSCSISVKCTSKRKNQSYVVGRFHFTKEQKQNKLWIALFARHKENFMFLGMLYLDNYKGSYLSLHKLREEDVISLDDFVLKMMCEE